MDQEKQALIRMNDELHVAITKEKQALIRMNDEQILAIDKQQLLIENLIRREEEYRELMREIAQVRGVNYIAHTD